MDPEIMQLLRECGQILAQMKVTSQRLLDEFQEQKKSENKNESIDEEETKMEVSIEDESQELKQAEIESKDISESAIDEQKMEVVVDADSSCDRPWLKQPLTVVAPADSLATVSDEFSSSHPSRLTLGLLQEHFIPGMYPLDDLSNLNFHFSPLSCSIFFPHKDLKNGGEASTLHLLPYLHFLPYNQTSAITLINYSKTPRTCLLIDLHPEKWNLNPFEYWIEGTLFVEPSVTFSTLSNFSFSLPSFISDKSSFSLLQFLFCSRLFLLINLKVAFDVNISAEVIAEISSYPEMPYVHEMLLEDNTHVEKSGSERNIILANLAEATESDIESHTGDVNTNLLDATLKEVSEVVQKSVIAKSVVAGFSGKEMEVPVPENELLIEDNKPGNCASKLQALQIAPVTASIDGSSNWGKEKNAYQVFNEMTQRALQNVSSAISKVLEESKSQISVLQEHFNRLAEIVREWPGQYYRYHSDWRSETQTVVSLMAFMHWLETEILLLHPQAQEKLGLDTPVFGLDIEDYLVGICFMTNELPKYVVNRVTYGDYDSPRKVLNFLTGLHAAFWKLNLRNDFLRKELDGMKYDLKRVEEVYFDGPSIPTMMRLHGKLDANANDENVFTDFAPTDSVMGRFCNGKMLIVAEDLLNVIEQERKGDYETEVAKAFEVMTYVAYLLVEVYHNYKKLDQIHSISDLQVNSSLSSVVI